MDYISEVHLNRGEVSMLLEMLRQANVTVTQARVAAGLLEKLEEALDDLPAAGSPPATPTT